MSKEALAIMAILRHLRDRSKYHREGAACARTDTTALPHEAPKHTALALMCETKALEADTLYKSIAQLTRLHDCSRLVEKVQSEEV